MGQARLRLRLHLVSQYLHVSMVTKPADAHSTQIMQLFLKNKSSFCAIYSKKEDICGTFVPFC